MGLSLITSPRELWQFGTHQRADRRTPLVLWAATLGNVAAVRFSTPRLLGGAAGYSVTTGKTLVLTRVLMHSDVANTSLSVGYSDSDRGMSNAADGANPVNLDSVGADGLGVLQTVIVQVAIDEDIYYEFPAGKFPRIVLPVGVVNLYCQFFGHEV